MKTEEILDQEYWDIRWKKGETGWDIGEASSPISEYFLQVEDKGLAILIPGCGNAHEAEFLLREGFKNLTLLDISPKACELIAQKFSHEVKVVCEDFFEHEGRYDLIVEQTFFCALDPVLREKYAAKMHELLKEEGKMVGVMFNKDFGNPFPPFGGSSTEYRALFEKYFEIKTLASCRNSIKARQDAEVFVNFVKKK